MPAMDGHQHVRGCGHLWAIGYDDMERADRVREQVTGLGWDKPYLLLEDIAVVVRHPDGSFTVDREPFPAVPNILSWTAVGFVAGLVLAAPLVGAGRRRCAWGCRLRRRRRGRDRRRLRPRGGGDDEARDVSPVRPGR